jgi:hypothetical protein
MQEFVQNKTSQIEARETNIPENLGEDNYHSEKINPILFLILDQEV